MICFRFVSDTDIPFSKPFEACFNIVVTINQYIEKFVVRHSKQTDLVEVCNKISYNMFFCVRFSFFLTALAKRHGAGHFNWTVFVPSSSMRRKGDGFES